jgi:hypothetical protein
MTHHGSTKRSKVGVPKNLHMFMHKHMKKKKKIRSGLIMAMLNSRKGGSMKNKKDKRKNGKNKQEAYLDGDY